MAFLLAAWPCAAAAAPVFQVFPGFGGFFRPGDWTPVSVLVENAPDSASAKPYTLDGILRIVSAPVEGDVTHYERRISVTHQQRLFVTLYAKFSENSPCSVEFVSDRGKRLWRRERLENELTPLNDGQRLWLIVTEQAGGFAAPNSMLLPGARRAYIAPEALPDQWFGYESVDLAIFARDPGAGFADPSQGEALKRWIRFGGRIVALAGAAGQTYKAGFLAPLLPVEIEGAIPMSFAVPGQEPVQLLAADARLKPGARALLVREGKPLASRWQVGLGEVSFAGVDLHSGAGFLPPDMRALWDSFAADAERRRRHSFGQSLAYANASLAFGRAARLPSLMLIFALLAAYAIIVGPVNFRILGRRRRLELAWITIPAIVIGFSALTYVIGFWAKGGMSIVREIEIARAGSGSSEALSEKLLGVFSPKKRAYDIENETPSGALDSIWGWRYIPFDPDAPFYNLRQTGLTSGSGWRLAIDESRPAMAIRERLMGQWTSQMFSALAAAPLGEGVIAQAEYHGDSIRLELENRTGIALRNAAAQCAGLSWPVKDIAPSERAAMELIPSAGAAEALAHFPAEVARHIASGSALPRSAEDDAAQTADYLRALAWRGWSRRAPVAAPAGDWPLRPRLIAWLDSPLASASIGGKPDRYSYGGMLIIDAPLALGDGPFSVAETHSAAALFDLSLSEFGEFFQSEAGEIKLAGCEAIFVCSPGFRDRPLQVLSADLRLSFSAPDELESTLSVFNYRANRWRDLARNEQESQEDKLHRLGPDDANPLDGSVFVRVAVMRDQGETGVAKMRMPRAAFAGMAL